MYGFVPDALYWYMAEPVEATVLELMPSGMVRLELTSRQQVLAHPAGVREKNFVRLRPGERVLVEVSPLDPGRGDRKSVV